MYRYFPPVKKPKTERSIPLPKKINLKPKKDDAFSKFLFEKMKEKELDDYNRTNNIFRYVKAYYPLDGSIGEFKKNYLNSITRLGRYKMLDSKNPGVINFRNVDPIVDLWR